MNQVLLSKKVGYAIKKARNDKQWTLKDLSKKTDLSTAYLSNVERGKTAPSIASLILILEQLDLPLDEVLEKKQ